MLASHSAGRLETNFVLLTKPLKPIRGCGCLNATFSNNLVMYVKLHTKLIVMTVLAWRFDQMKNCLLKFALTGLLKSYHEWWFESLCTFLCSTLFLFESLGTLWKCITRIWHNCLSFHIWLELWATLLLDWNLNNRYSDVDSAYYHSLFTLINVLPEALDYIWHFLGFL